MYKSGFEKHDIKHTSPSQLNKWIDCPAAWIIQYLYKENSSLGVAGQIGIQTEWVVSQVLTDSLSFDDAVSMAKKSFLKDNKLNTNKKELERVNDIEQMAALAIGELRQYGKPDFSESGQHKIELVCNGDGWQLPVIGYIDFYYPDHGLIVDLKTTLRAPSVMSDSHKRQGAIYQKAMGNKQTKFLYVTPKKAIWHEVEDVDNQLAQIKQYLNRQEKFLRMDVGQMRDIVPINADSFYWMGCEDLRKRYFGI